MITETSGPTDLAVGAIAEGQYGKRVGTTFVGGMPTAGDVGAVPTARVVATTAPLQGGGPLSGDLTLSVDDATAGAKGVVQLTGDFGGTAASPEATKARGLRTAGGVTFPMGEPAEGHVLKIVGGNVVGVYLAVALSIVTFDDLVMDEAAVEFPVGFTTVPAGAPV